MIKVTNENRAEFVSLYLEHVLNSAVLDRLVIITTDELQPHSTKLGSDPGSALCSPALETLAFKDDRIGGESVTLIFSFNYVEIK